MNQKWQFRGHYRTNEWSGGLTMNRFPKPKTPGRTLMRSAAKGFQVDQQGGNRIPKVGLERRAIALGHTVVRPTEPLPLPGRLPREVKARNCHVKLRDAAQQWRPLPSRRVEAAARRASAALVHDFKAALAARGGVL
jgi:hypothetical protein